MKYREADGGGSRAQEKEEESNSPCQRIPVEVVNATIICFTPVRGVTRYTPTNGLIALPHSVITQAIK